MHRLDPPDDWQRVKLREVAGGRGVFTDGDWILSEDMSAHGEIRLIQLADIGVGTFLDNSARFITREKREELKCTLLQASDVLVSRMAHPIARACIVPDLRQDAITAVDVSIIRVDPSIADPRFVMFLCNSPVVRKQAERLSRGSTRSRITRSDLSEIEVPLPPVPEQRRIVARVEEMLERIDRVRFLRQAARREAGSVLSAALAEVFARDELKNCPRKLLGEVAYIVNLNPA